MRWLPLLVAAACGLALHGLLLAGLDLHDLPGPGGALLARDLLQGSHSQGPASWLAAPPVWLLGLESGLRVVASASLGCAMLGAGLAAWALAGRRAAPWAAALTASWALVTHQGLLVDAGGLAWGLSWLGLGLCWWALGARRPIPAALGAAVLVLGVAVKASALPVLALLPLALWMPADAASSEPRPGLRLPALALLGGALLGAGLGWLLQGPDLPWLGAQAVQGAEGGAGWLSAVLALAGRGLPHGSFPLLALLAAAGVALCVGRRRQAVLLLALTLAALALVGEARAERLQPRHLLPASLGLVVLTAAVTRWRRPRWLAPTLLGGLVLLAVLDSLAFAHAFAAQRARFAGTQPAALPAAPAPFAGRYPELPWPVFFESSLGGVAELLPLAAGAPGPVAGVSWQERRDVHLELVTLERGASYRRLSQDRCCLLEQATEACAAEVVEALDGAGALLILPGKLEVVAPEDRAFAAALLAALPQRQRRPARWIAVQGSGSGGELPCRGGR